MVGHTSLCKIFWRVLKKTLLSFLSETWSISPHPHGFLPRRSYLSNLLVFEEAVTRMMEEGRTVDVICLDFSKAFLFLKIKSFGLSDAMLRWIEAYLSGRASSVGGGHSGAIPMHSGMTQGSTPVSPFRKRCSLRMISKW